MWIYFFPLPLINKLIIGQGYEKEMIKMEKHRVCPVERAGHLEGRLRSWIQNPEKILGPYVRKGMAVLDMGCGPGFFSVPMARMVGETGRVVACDLQTGMLKKLADKIEDTDIQERIILHQCQENRIGVSGAFDFALAFYMIHELPDQQSFFKELSGLMKKDGKVFIVEPPFHVSRADFSKTLMMAEATGFSTVSRPKFLFSKAVVLQCGKNS